MISQARLTANRLNSQKSTGPKTQEGKAQSSLNALKHGLSATQSSALLPTEDQNAYLLFCDQIRDDLNPKSPMEYILTERITQTLWRMRRIPTAEAELFNRHNEARRDQVRQANQKRQDAQDYEYRFRRKTPPPLEQSPLPQDLPPSQTLAAQFESHDDKSNPFMRLSRYEAHLNRSYHRDLKLLKQLQKDRLENPRLQEDSTSSYSDEFQIDPTDQPQEQLNQIFPDHPLPQDQTPQIQKVQNEAKLPTTNPNPPTSNNQPPITNTMIQNDPTIPSPPPTNDKGQMTKNKSNPATSTLNQQTTTLAPKTTNIKHPACLPLPNSSKINHQAIPAVAPPVLLGSA